MITVLKHGNKRKLICKNCNCEFIFEKEDIKHNTTNGHDHIYFVNCPDCDNEITVYP